MKKIFAILFAASMMATISVNAFAAELPDNATNDPKSKDVIANYVSGTSADVVYKVDLEWGSMVFTYTAASQGTWNTETHKYDGTTEAAWSYEDGANQIKVTNHSNADVSVDIANTDVLDGINLEWDVNTLHLATADNGENGEAGTPTNATANLTVSGDLAETSDSVKIATVVLTLNEG